MTDYVKVFGKQQSEKRKEKGIKITYFLALANF